MKRSLSKHSKWYVFLIVILVVGCWFFFSNKGEETGELKVTKTPIERSESLLHTACQIQIFHDGDQAIQAMRESFDYIKDMEDQLGTYNEGSDVYRINENAGKGPVKVGDAAFDVIKKGCEYAEKTNGRLDITIGAVVRLWRIGSEDARKPEDWEIKEALKKIDYKKVKLNEEEHTVELLEKGMAIELGAISKGYIADGIKAIMQRHGVRSAIVNLGGNVLVLGKSPSNSEGWRIGIQNPDETRGDTIGSERVKDSSVVTSGIYEQYLQVGDTKYHHILNPQTGYPVENNLSGVTIFSKTSVNGDALSTSAFLYGLEDGMAFINQLDGVEAVFITKDHKVYVTDGLKGHFKVNHKGYQLQ